MAKDATVYARERAALRGAINSFHALTPAERQAARPHVIRTFVAQPGTTVAELARRSPLGAEAEGQLRLMNGLYPAGEPKPGQRLKIVQ